MPGVEGEAALLTAMQARAAGLDRDGAFPSEDIDALRAAGLLDAEDAAAMPELLRLLGRGNLAVARLFEAHVNAIRLVRQFGDPAIRAVVAADARAGALFGLWVTDPPDAPLTLEHGVLRGTKGPSSGAGHLTRALVTVGDHMAIIALQGSEPVRAITGLHGMRAAANGVVTLDGAPVLGWVGAPGDYLREPEFSCGAWRGSAAASGALDALVAAVRSELRRKHQTDAPMQQARFATLLIAQETARLWVTRAADAAECAGSGGDPAEAVATVNLARIAVETACLDAIRLAQRSLGLAAFVAPHPVERLARDLGTYLRQPAPDAVLLEAAAWHLNR